VKVANTGGTGVRLRVDPSKTARVAGVLPEGTTLDIVGPDKQAEGLTWKNVRAPGDGRGWVASDYVVAVAGSSPSASSNTQASTAPAASASASATPAPSTASSSGATTSPASSTTTTPASSSTGSTPPATTPASSGSTGSADVLKVDVNVKQAKVKAGGDQSVDIVVTKGGQPVSGAQVTVKTSPTGETPAAGATDASGKVSVNWKPTGSPGFIGVGVSALGPDGNAGVGGASFEITAN
jgi:hypothetical protein